MNTTRKLHIGMMATMAAVAVLTGCQRREEGDTTTVTPPPATSTAPSGSSSSSTTTTPGTPGYTGPAGESSSSSSTMSSPGTSGSGTSSSTDMGSAGSPGGSASSSSSTTTPGTSGYVGGSTSGSTGSGADTSVSDQDRYRSGGGTTGSDTGTSGSGTSGSGSGTSGSGTSGSGTGTSGGGTSPSSSLDRPFRDVVVSTPGMARGPAAWREALGVEVLRVADADKMMDKSGKGMSKSDMSSDTHSGAGGKLSKKDENFIKKAAAGGMFEVEAARLAAEKATDPQLKTFAEKLRDQHQQANDELKQIASARGMTMPTQLPSKEKAMLDKLNKASGDKFDKEFISMVGLRDHKQDIRDFENARNETSDPELKAWIEKTLPTLRTHLAEAQQMSGHEGMKMQGYGGQEHERQQGYTGQEQPESQQLEKKREKGIEGTGVGGSK